MRSFTLFTLMLSLALLSACAPAAGAPAPTETIDLLASGGEISIVAYARAGGNLADDDGDFRMVLPGAESKLNVRMLVELQVIQ